MNTIRMINSRTIIIILAGCFIVSLTFQGKKVETFSYKLFQTNKGWGYDILVDNKVFIHQEMIPAIPENKGFENQDEARKVAFLVITKLKENGIPQVSKFEIEQILKN